ncbi:GL12011 [Drosophila persimilis]|uniref:Uncharacterized protein n=2 Tax=pseudoobscura subgroup TaxID=32358 RepID=A0A6I8USH9_DROPS|nr:uncharacterized protein LOC4803180 [Drosophila pseudoobscura]XP_002019807.1 uncharacterized protein LOC6594309 [Drosophila persimilis]XP_017142035.1 uncharacterized protein LOC108155617 [Drosophila miranda]EDW38441.1 GL12011 [Drosophila persimilis]
MGLVRTAVGAAGDRQPPAETVASVNHCPTYRQIAGATTGAGSAPAKRVPILFSTNRGLYLRVAQPVGDQEVLTLQPRGQNYNISFCDLERWSTNRANVVSLEDTFTITHQRNMTPEVHLYQPRLWNNHVSYSLMH